MNAVMKEMQKARRAIRRAEKAKEEAHRALENLKKLNYRKNLVHREAMTHPRFDEVVARLTKIVNSTD